MYYSHKVAIPKNDKRYEGLISKRESTATTEADREILKILKLTRELEQSHRKLNSSLATSVSWLGVTLVGVSLFQLSVVFSVFRSKKHSEPD